MNWIKSIIKKYLSTFVFFYQFLKYRIAIMLFTSFMLALVDGIGLTMFLPLLQSTAGEGLTAKEDMGQMRVVIDVIENAGIHLDLNNVLLLMAFVFGLKGLIRYLEGYYRVKAKMVFMKTIRHRMVDGLARMRFSHFVNSDAGQIQNTMSVEVNRVIGSFENYFKTGQGMIMILIYVSLAFLSNPGFAGLVLVAGLLSNLIYRRMYRITKRLSREVSGHGHGFQSFLIQSVNYFKYLRATRGLPKYNKKLKQKIDEMEHAFLRIGHFGAMVHGSREAVSILMVIIVIYIQINFLGGTLSAIILSLMFFYRSLGAVLIVQGNWNAYLNHVGALETIQEFTKELQTHREIQPKTRFAGPLQQMEVQHLDFSFGDGTRVLKDLNFSVKHGETVAVVGESGSGKTTLTNLITGLYDNFEGNILLNNQNLSDINRKSWQEHIGYITQEAVIFDDNIANNVSFWDDLSDPKKKERFDDALKKAAIYDFVMGLKDKEETRLGNNGINLSGGQRQRISIARELYKEVDLLVLDEATSALDSETELIIQQNIERLHGEYTMIIIAHRLSTIRNADRIIVLDKGVVENMGTFDELMERSKRFRKMVELQEI
jgi:subfamily B ATP-binding cassette protein MsbA